MSIVRQNLLTRAGYTPYCGSENCPGHWPRTVFDEKIGQFKCQSCGYTTGFEPAFIEQYKRVRGTLTCP